VFRDYCFYQFIVINKISLKYFRRFFASIHSPIKNIFTIKNGLVLSIVIPTGYILREIIKENLDVNVFIDFYTPESILYYLFMASLGLILHQRFSIETLVFIFLLSLSFRIVFGYFDLINEI